MRAEPHASCALMVLAAFLQWPHHEQVPPDAFVATPNQPRGDAATFRCAAEAAGAAVGARWPDGAWPAYVGPGEAEGLPAVHHSERFAAAYRPAYRGGWGAGEMVRR